MRGTPIRHTDFSGGVNLKASREQVGPTQARDLLNVVSTVRGSIRKRNGMENFADLGAAGSTNEARSLFPMEFSASGSNRWLIYVTSGNDIRRISSAGATASIKAALASTVSKWEFAMGAVEGTHGPLYGVNGTDQPITYDGVAAAAIAWTLSVGGNPPNAKYIAYHENRVFLAGLTAVAGTPFSTLPASRLKNTVVWSELATAGGPRNFGGAGPSTNFVQIEPDDGDEITGLGKVGSYLLVFKRKKTYVIYDSSTGANRRISDSIGCAANRSIVESPNGTFFLAMDAGIYVTDGNNLTLVSENIEPLLAAIEPSQRANCAGAWIGDHYYLTITHEDTVLNWTVDFDWHNKSWWMHDYAGYQWVVMRFTEKAELFVAAVGDRGSTPRRRVSKAFVDGVTQDNGENFTMEWEGPWLSFGTPYLKKRVRQVSFEGIGPFDLWIGKDFQEHTLKAENVAPASETTYGSGSTTYGDEDSFFGDLGAPVFLRVYSFGVGRQWSVVFEAEHDKQVEIIDYNVNYTLRND